jgi:hypothetical protein
MAGLKGKAASQAMTVTRTQRDDLKLMGNCIFVSPVFIGSIDSY